MIHPSILLCFCTLVFQINPIFPIQQYDHTMCTSKAEAEIPNSNYLCNSKNSSCDTFIVYRAQKHYQTLNSISYLFNATISHLLLFNNMSKNDPDNIPPDREIIVPVSCSCTDNFFKAVHLYNASSSDSVLTIACEVFEGLVNPQSLIAKNKLDSYLIEVPVKCACPDSSDIGNGTHFLVTYPVIRADNINLIARRFGVSEKMILDSNKLDHLTTIFPQTTILVPTKDVPVLNLDIISSPHVPLFGHQTTNSNKGKRSNTIKIILGAIVILFLIILIPGIYVLIRKKHYHVRIKMRVSSQLSPDLLDGMSKLKSSLICFKFEEIKNATEDFSHDCVIGSTFYKGKICDSDVVIEKFNSTEVANNVVSILTKINHLNMVRLEGFCHVPKPFLVYEFVENGSLRECLNDSKKARLLTWKKRVQIATDIAQIRGQRYQDLNGQNHKKRAMLVKKRM
ncbi:hypothetical protein ACJIZ3_020925 [Penstemon smallii]|uniref:LysM domain-containing protein n=1 Tax=Penstemon smallii TaxID=265156 RepID=A0ABD3SKH0_9LAMI